jgi:hypothetical protein
MKLNHNKKSVKISLNLFALYAVMVCGIVFALPAFAADDRWSWSKISPHSSFR